MQKAKRIVTSLLERAGVGVDGVQPWDIRVKDERFYGRALQDRSLGLGESYMEGWWECARLDEFFQRVCAFSLDEMAQTGLSVFFDVALERLLNRQTRRKSLDVTKKHDNLGNDMFLSWLDPYSQCSCGYFADTDDLAQAQKQKLELICSSPRRAAYLSGRLPVHLARGAASSTSITGMSSRTG